MTSLSPIEIRHSRKKVLTAMETEGKAMRTNWNIYAWKITPISGKTITIILNELQKYLS